MTAAGAGRVVIACFRPLPGKQDELLALTQTHVQRLRELGLATERSGIAMQTPNGDVIEVFEWVSSDAILSAHEHPAVRAMWAEYEQCCTYLPVTEVASAAELFPDFSPLPTVASPHAPVRERGPVTTDSRSAAAIYVQDAERVAAFYTGVLGLLVEETGDGFLVLGSPALELALVTMPPQLAVEFELTLPPQRREETPLKLAFAVPSIGEARTAAAKLGGVIDPPEREWSWRGTTVCDGHDPEGNVFQVRASD